MSWSQSTQSCQMRPSDETKLPPITKIFRASSNLTAISIHDLSQDHEIKDVDNRSWESLLLPSKAGLFWMEDGGVVNPYSVSMFHQLHCLVMIRDAFTEALALADSAEGDGRSKRKAPNPHGHLDHCFHYLAQVGCSSTAYPTF